MGHWPWRRSAGDAWEDFWNGEPPEDIVGTPEFEQMFLPWFVFSYVPDPFTETPDDEDDADEGSDADEPFDWPEQSLALEWLATQRHVATRSIGGTPRWPVAVP